MTVKVRLDSVFLETIRGRVEYRFTSDLIVLAGPTGVGKTTLLELVKYGFGGNGKLAPKAVEAVHDVILEVTFGTSRFRLARSLDRAKARVVRVTDLVTQERLQDHYVEPSTEPSLSVLLMTALGLPADARAAATGGSSSKPGNRITFADIFSFMYVQQSEINRDIAHSQDSYLDPKRKAVFELLFGITNAEILALQSRFNKLKGDLQVTETQHQTVLSFLRNSRTEDRAVAQQSLEAAVADELEAEAAQAALREDVDPVADRETAVLRDLLGEAEQSLADARKTAVDLARQQGECAAERRRVRGDLDRYHRMRDAGERLADFEFTLCPRCMQPLTTRPVPEGACRVCLQPDPVHDALDGNDLYEVRQLADQLDEMDGQLELLAGRLATVTQAISAREQLVKNLNADLDARTRDRVTPRLQAFSDVFQRIAAARARRQELEHVLRQWDSADDIAAEARRIRAEREEVKSELDGRAEDLRARREALFASLNEEFQRTVDEIGIPGVTSASIDTKTYLPLLDNGPYQNFSHGGGIITAVQVAYWTTLLTVAIYTTGYHNDYPTLLIIDTPQLAQNDQVQLNNAVYHRLATQRDAGNRGEVQLIIADNAVPADYKRSFAEEEFSYERPTISSVPHPGRGKVKPIHES
ncbi:AAA family ATPase [Trebonia sp.]|uniref:AAA family ATPase n=1 Tax=Trebonia sp. TaxID=2767075 RepID=UPI0026275CE3|nr:AAA family ATPase [Trebonia sp.]